MLEYLPDPLRAGPKVDTIPADGKRHDWTSLMRLLVGGIVL